MMVDYLVENKLYSEIKGRTMWVDFANSKVINAFMNLVRNHSSTALSIKL